MRVEEREVADDDRYWQRDSEHSGERATRTDQLAQRGLGNHVSESDRRHRHYRPPETCQLEAATHIRQLLRQSDTIGYSDYTSIHDYCTHT